MEAQALALVQSQGKLNSAALLTWTMNGFGEENCQHIDLLASRLYIMSLIAEPIVKYINRHHDPAYAKSFT